MAEVTGGRGVNLVLDPVGGPIREQSMSVPAPFGRVVAYGDLGRHEQGTTSVRDLWKNNRTVAGFNIEARSFSRSPDLERFLIGGRVYAIRFDGHPGSAVRPSAARAVVADPFIGPRPSLPGRR